MDRIGSMVSHIAELRTEALAGRTSSYSAAAALSLSVSCQRPLSWAAFMLPAATFEVLVSVHVRWFPLMESAREGICTFEIHGVASTMIG